MSCHLKRFLLSTEQVDHRDEDKLNDVIGNLQILSPQKNTEKNRIHRKATMQMVKLRCPSCESEFIKPLNNSYLRKGGHFSACSRKCVHEVLKKGLSISQLKEIGGSQIIGYFKK